MRKLIVTLLAFFGRRSQSARYAAGVNASLQKDFGIADPLADNLCNLFSEEIELARRAKVPYYAIAGTIIVDSGEFDRIDIGNLNHDQIVKLSAVRMLVETGQV